VPSIGPRLSEPRKRPSHFILKNKPVAVVFARALFLMLA
jgi:hypothetical protein